MQQLLSILGVAGRVCVFDQKILFGYRPGNGYGGEPYASRIFWLMSLSGQRCTRVEFSAREQRCHLAEY